MLKNAPGTIAPGLVAHGRLTGGAAFILTVGLLGTRALGQQTAIISPVYQIGSGSSVLDNGNWTFNLNGDLISLINFDAYGIPAGATVSYIGQGSFVVYNNIQGSAPSLIDGTLNGGGGTIYLINPAGVIFGPGAQMLNVGTLFAAAASLVDPENPSNTFEVGTGQVVIQQFSTVSADQAVHLIGANIVNSGTVSAGSLVTMVAATGTVTIFPESTDPQIFSVSQPGANPPPDENVGIRNEGTITVGSGGTIRLGAADVYGAGIVHAASGSIAAANGTVRMDAVGRTIESAGQLAAGTVQLNADVLEASGTIRADTFGLTGNLVATDDLTITGQEVEGQPATAASITIGGSVDGDGVEGSSVSITLDAATSSVGGDIGASGTVGEFTTGGDLDLTGAGDASVAATTLVSIGGDLTKQAAGSLLIDGGDVVLGGDASTTDGSLTIVGNSITLDGQGSQSISAVNGALALNADVNKAFGGLSLSAGTTMDALGIVDVAAGALSATSGGAMSFAGNVSAGTDLSLTSTGGALTTGGTVTATVGSVTATSGGAMNLAGNVSGGTEISLTSGAALTANGAVVATSGAVSMNAVDALSVATNVTAGTNLTMSGSSIVLTSADAQTLTAENGALSLTGDVVKSTGDLVLVAGTTLSAGGDLQVDAGSLTATAEGTVSLNGDVVASSNVAISGSSIDLKSSGAQSIASTSGTVSLTGDLEKALGDLTITGTSIDANGDLEATAGFLKLDAIEALTLGGDAIGGTDLTLIGTTITLDGAGAQRLEATSGALDLSVGVTKATGNLSLKSGTTMEVGGDVQVTAGSLSAISDGEMKFEGDLVAGTSVTLNAGDAMTLGGDVTATAGLVSITSQDDIAIDGNVTGATTTTIDGDTITLTSDAAQSLVATAGELLLNGNLTKASGNLSLSGGTTLKAFGSLVASSGSITATSVGLMRLGGDVVGATDVTLGASAFELVGTEAQALTATDGTLTLNGNLAKAEGDLALTAKTIDANGSVQAMGGSLLATATEGLSFSGDLIAGTDLTIDGAAITLDGVATQAIVAEAGALTLNNSVTKAAGDLALTAGTSIDVDGGIGVGAGNFSATAATALNLNGAIDAGTNMALRGATIQLANDLTAGGQLSITGDVTLAEDSNWTASSMIVDGKIDGERALTIDSTGGAAFFGDIGTTSRLTSFTANSGLILFMVDANDAEDTTRTVRADAFSLNQTQRVVGAAVDLGSNGDLVIETDAFTASAGRKMTVVGDLTISNGVDGDGNVVASSSVTIGDVNTGGRFSIDAETLTIETRQPGLSITSVGPVNPDYGVDFVSLGGFDFNFTTLVVTDAGNAPTFASPNGTGDLNGNLGEFTMYNSSESVECIAGLSGGRGLTTGDFYSTSSNQFFDVIAKNTLANPVTALAGAIDEFQPSPEATPTSATQDLEGFSELGPIFRSLRLRSASAEELEALANGGAVLMDLDDGLGFGVGERGGQSSTSFARIAPGRVRELLATDAEINAFLDAGSAEFEANRAAFARTAQALQTAASDGRPLGDLVREMAASGDLAGLTSARLIGEYVQRGESLGLTAAERAVLRDAAGVGANWPQAIVPAQLGITDPSNPLFGFDVPGDAFDKDFWSAIAASGAGR